MGGYEGGYKGVDMRGGGEGGQCGYEGRYISKNARVYYLLMKFKIDYVAYKHVL